MKRFTLSSLVILLFLCNLLLSANADPIDEDIYIGVLSYRGDDNAIKRWGATAEYLTKNIPGYRFQLMPLDLNGMSLAVAQNRVQFILTNPGNYVELESKYGVSRIATIQLRHPGQIVTRFGAVIIVRADNKAIQTLEDLEDKSFMAVDPNAFGGFQMAWRELVSHGIDPFTDFSHLEFVGFPQDQVAVAVYEGRVDAATLRSETLMRMVETGRFKLSDFRILNPQNVADYNLPLSTRLYPEWPFAKNKQTSRELATKVTLALLAMPADHPAAVMSRTAGWTVPLDYTPVHALMQELNIGPYKILRETSLRTIARKYAVWLFALVIVVILLAALVAYISNTNRRLRETDRNLRNEIAVRKQSEAKLADYKDTLEQRVISRTLEIEQANKSLQKSQNTLHKLVDITSAPRLTHDEKLIKLLETGREYYQTAVGNLSSLSGGDKRSCTVAGKEDLIAGLQGPLNQSYIQKLLDAPDTTLDIPDFKTVDFGLSGGVPEPFKSYLATAVYVKGAPHCILEFADTNRRTEHYTRWDHNILEVMAQWIGSEIEKQEAIEEKQRHQAELARVGRVTAMGEMAAGLAHELNQPLTGAINFSSGCLRRLKRGDFDKAKLIQGLERTVEGATLAADIIRHLREFVQKGHAERKPTSLNEVVLNIVDLVSMEIKRHQASVSLQLAEHLPEVNANTVQLEQVVLNFIRNGLDAMEIIEPSKRKLLIGTATDGHNVTLTVTDQGHGILPEAETKLFDAFYTTKAEGMGMGLSISRSIVEMHNGVISAKNMAVGGACFSFALPIECGN